MERLEEERPIKYTQKEAMERKSCRGCEWEDETASGEHCSKCIEETQDKSRVIPNVTYLGQPYELCGLQLGEFCEHCKYMKDGECKNLDGKLLDNSPKV